MNKKISLTAGKLFLALCIAFLTVSFISCQKNYQKLTEIRIEPADGRAVIYFYLSEGEVSLLQVSIDPLPKKESYPKYITPAGRVCYYWLEGLDNGTEYTVRVDNLDGNYKIISTQTSHVTPTADTFVFNYTGREEPFVKVPAGTNLVTLKGVAGKYISFASLNVGKEAIPPLGQRLLVDNLNLGNPRSALPQPEQHSVKKQETRFETPFIFHEWQNNQEQSASSRSAAQVTPNASETKDTFDISNPSVGDKRTIYLDNNNDTFKTGNNDWYEQKEVTLLGIGKDGSQLKCLVWVENSCISEDKCGGKMVNAELAQNLADTFVDYYLHVTDIAGKESNKISSYNKNGDIILFNMSEKSKTGEAVNIVLYDIGNDYEKPESVVYMGYFHGKDYYEVSKNNKDVNISNCGKYVYLDTPTCNCSFDENGGVSYLNGNKDDKGKYIPSGRAISTLMHEFQHLIYHGTKTGCTWYTEMFSMLMEDILYDDLVKNYEIRREDNARDRLWEFNCGYLWDWTNSFFSYEAYAPTYAFGAWLVRNHGGIQLIKQMYEESDVGCDGIVKAVNDLNGTQYEWKDLLEQFLTACAIYTDNFEGTDLPTFNRTCGESFTSHNHRSILLPLDLYAKEFNWYDSTGTPEWRGPILYDTYFNGADIPPSSFMIRNGFEAVNDTVMVLFTPQVQPTADYNEEFFIYIQDKFTNYVEEKTSGETK